MVSWNSLQGRRRRHINRYGQGDMSFAVVERRNDPKLYNASTIGRPIILCPLVGVPKTDIDTRLFKSLIRIQTARLCDASSTIADLENLRVARGDDISTLNPHPLQ